MKCSKCGYEENQPKEGLSEANGSLFPLADIQRKCGIGLSTALKVRDYLYATFSPQAKIHACKCRKDYEAMTVRRLDEGLCQCPRCDGIIVAQAKLVPIDKSLAELVKDKLCVMQFHGCPAWFNYVAPIPGSDNEKPSLEQMLSDLSNTILRAIEGSGYYIVKDKSPAPVMRVPTVEEMIEIARPYLHGYACEVDKKAMFGAILEALRGRMQ